MKIFENFLKISKNSKNFKKTQKNSKFSEKLKIEPKFSKLSKILLTESENIWFVRVGFKKENSAESQVS